MDTKNLEKIIGCQSVSGQEKEIMIMLYKLGKKLKVSTFKQDKNIVYHIKGKDKKKALIFNGHVDTVSAGNINDWQHPPYGKIVETVGDKIYGLGSSDMKSAVFAFTEVAKHFQSKAPPIDLWFSFVVNEETDGSGTKSFIGWFKKSYFKAYDEINAIIGEPTGLEEISIGHKGNYFVKITSYGDAGHGAYPERIGKHAVKEMMKIVTKLEALGKQWQKKYFHKKLGIPSISMLTSINAGDIKSPNKFPDSCSASFDIRTTPKLHDQVLVELKKSLRTFECKIETVYDPCHYSFTNEEEKIVKKLQTIVGNTPLKVANGASDQCFFSEVNIPTVVFGPGEKGVIHKPDEYCHVSKIKKSIAVYIALADAMGIA